MLGNVLWHHEQLTNFFFLIFQLSLFDVLIHNAIPIYYCIRKFVPIGLRKYNEFTICNGLNVFRHRFALVRVCKQVIFINKIFCDFIAFIIVITNTQNAFQNKNNLAKHLSCFYKIFIFCEVAFPLLFLKSVRFAVCSRCQTAIYILSILSLMQS